MKLRIDNLVECYQSSAIKYCTTVKRLKRFIIKKRQKKKSGEFSSPAKLKMRMQKRAHSCPSNFLNYS